jgi:hypothetical protein
LVGIAEDARVHRTPAANGHDTGELPVIEKPRAHCVLTSEGLRLPDPGKRETVTLIRDTRATLGTGGVRILHCDRTAGDERILTVVGCMGKRVCKPEAKAVRHTAAHGESRSVIDARRRALKLVDRT